MPLKFKIDIMQELKAKGYNTTRLRREQLLSETVITKIRRKDPSLTFDILSRLCYMLQCQPADIIEFVPDFTDREYFEEKKWIRVPVRTEKIK